jgi:rRNA small subunit pseudouridine methyltransferase Nep1
MLSIVIADSEIELVPDEIAGHAAIRRKAKRRGKPPAETLLDSNMDHVPMRRLVDGDRRGRPDIAHLCLLVALDSISSREGDLLVYVHTREDVILTFDPGTRLPRVQGRFYGILEKILTSETGTDLIGYDKMNLAGLCLKIAPDITLALTPSGKRSSLAEEMSGKEHVLSIIGGFPRGEFKSPVESLADATISCYPDSLNAWTVLNEVVFSYRNSR